MKRQLFAMLGLGLMVTLLGTAPLAHADVNNFTITSFSADDTLSRADPQGELHIVERIGVDFTDQNHGLLRALPNTYKNHRLQLHINAVSSSSGAPAQYSTYTQNGNTVLKIGDPDRTVTGNQEYTIDYTVHNVVSFYPDHDELYWDINGDQWTQPFEQVLVTVHVPGGLHQTHVPICYTGIFGSKEKNCTTVVPGMQRLGTSAITTKALPGGQTLSVVLGFNKGYFRSSTWYDTLGEYTNDILAFSLPVVLLGGVAGWFWRRHGRDPKGRGTIVPEYDAPDGLSPIEVGTLLDFRTDNKDITATIIDLAIRRYLTIIEQKQDRKLRRDLTTYTLRLEKSDFSKLNEFEKTILNDLFVQRTAGEEIDLAHMKNKLSKTAAVLRVSTRKSLIAHVYIRPSVVTLKNAFLGLGTLAALLLFGGIMGYFGVPGAFGAGTFVGGAIAFLFLRALSARTAKGVAAKEHILGLKMYLEVAEAERIRKLQSPNARYAEKSAGPKRTVQLFEKLLPYAMILGVEQQWAKQFEDMYRTPPDWYNGNWTTFNVVYLTSSLSSGIGQEVNTVFSAPSSSSGSGFGGGGAGGGGGGGGGGGW